MTSIRTDVYSDSARLAHSVAQQLISLIHDAISARQKCTIALAGGSTPRSLYQLLASDEFRDEIDWRHIHVFLGDERYVPNDHEDSNARMAHEALLTHVSIPDEQVHRVLTDRESAEAAAEYEQALLSTLERSDDGVPVFDIVLLGIGGDGHTASLFPETDALRVQDRFVVENWVPQQNAMRITVTIPVLHYARTTILMATGEDKADAIWRAVEGPPDIETTPSQVLRDARGRVIFALDQAAGSKLSG